MHQQQEEYKKINNNKENKKPNNKNEKDRIGRKVEDEVKGNN